MSLIKEYKYNIHGNEMPYTGIYVTYFGIHRPRSGPSQPPESQKRSKVEGSQEADSPSSIPVAATDREARLATRNRLRLQAGGDSQGQEVFHSPEALWKQHQDKDGTHDSWYQVRCVIEMV